MDDQDHVPGPTAACFLGATLVVAAVMLLDATVGIDCEADVGAALEARVFTDQAVATVEFSLLVSVEIRVHLGSFVWGSCEINEKILISLLKVYFKIDNHINKS